MTPLPSPTPDSTRRARRPSLRTLAWAACAVAGLSALALHAACLPFYAGGPLGPHARWRLEHGRLTLARSPVPHHVTFFIDANSEALRWSPEFRSYNPGDWTLTLPLWLVWAPALLTALAPTGLRTLRRTLPPP